MKSPCVEFGVVRVVNGPVQTEWTAVWTVDRVGPVPGVKDHVDRLDR